MDRGAWWAADHRVAQSRTRLKRAGETSVYSWYILCEMAMREREKLKHNLYFPVKTERSL